MRGGTKMKEKKHIEIVKPNRKYISVNRAPKNNNVEITKIGAGIYFYKEIIPLGNLAIEIKFLVSNSGKIGAFVKNNYFATRDSLEHLSEYEDYKKDLLNRIKIDLEEKRSLTR
jgi:hypothetical protein